MKELADESSERAAATHCQLEAADVDAEWVPITQVQPGHVVKVREVFATSDAELPVQLVPGTLGKVIDVDEDGDAYVDFPSLGQHLKVTQCWVSKRNFNNMSTMSLR